MKDDTRNGPERKSTVEQEITKVEDKIAKVEKEINAVEAKISHSQHNEEMISKEMRRSSYKIRRTS